jgi:hypothetical protein
MTAAKTVEIKGYEETFEFELTFDADGDVRIQGLSVCESGYWTPYDGLLFEFLDANSGEGPDELAKACACYWAAANPGAA